MKKGILHSISLVLLLSFLNTSAQSVEATINRDSIQIGEQIELRFKVETDSSSAVLFPEGQTFVPLELVESLATDTLKENEKFILLKTYKLTQFDSGAYRIPEQQITIDGKPYLSQTFEINVRDVKVDTLEQGLYDVKSRIQVEKPNSALLQWIIGLIILALIGLGLYFAYQKWFKNAAQKEELDPYQDALHYLNSIQVGDFLKQEEVKSFYSTCVEKLKRYVYYCFEISSLDRTSAEFISLFYWLIDNDKVKIESAQIKALEQWLDRSDLVKFAKYHPELTALEQDQEFMRAFIQAIEEGLPEPEPEEIQEQIRFEQERKKMERKMRVKKAMIAAASLLLLLVAGAFIQLGPKDFLAELTFDANKNLRDRNWYNSKYAYPSVELESPEVLVRQENNSFFFENERAHFEMGLVSLQADPEKEWDFRIATESRLAYFQEKGYSSILPKEEEFITPDGVQGVKTYGSAINAEGDRVNYAIITFGGKGFSQEIWLSWLDGNSYAQEISDRILNSLKVSTEI